MIYQDGDTFYHEEHGALVSYPGMVAHDYDIEGALAARAQFCADHPDLAHLFEG